jgi:chemotaxis protein methyltransferase CheR
MNNNLEFSLLLDAITERYGYDLRVYTMASLKRRIDKLLACHGFNAYSDLFAPIIKNELCINSFINGLSVTVSEMFRDPAVFKALREKVLPVFKDYPYLKIWVAGCANGEELYSLAILLSEEGLLGKSLVYATDINSASVNNANKGFYKAASFKKYTKNYQDSGGKQSLSDYYSCKYDVVRMDPALKRNVVFAQHDLCRDGIFTTAHLILCRNVLIYLDRHSQHALLEKFTNSLYDHGYLCLGDKENLRYSPGGEKYQRISGHLKLYRKLTETNDRGINAGTLSCLAIE